MAVRFKATPCLVLVIVLLDLLGAFEQNTLHYGNATTTDNLNSL
jgi:hypothetical protein